MHGPHQTPANPGSLRSYTLLRRVQLLFMGVLMTERFSPYPGIRFRQVGAAVSEVDTDEIKALWSSK